MFQFFPEEEVTLIGEGENGGDPEFLTTSFFYILSYSLSHPSSLTLEAFALEKRSVFAKSPDLCDQAKAIFSNSLIIPLGIATTQKPFL